MCLDLHVGKIFLHHFPHMRIKPKTRVPLTSLLLQGCQFANPVVGFQMVRFLTFLSCLRRGHAIPPKPRALAFLRRYRVSWEAMPCAGENPDLGPELESRLHHCLPCGSRQVFSPSETTLYPGEQKTCLGIDMKYTEVTPLPHPFPLSPAFRFSSCP